MRFMSIVALRVVFAVTRILSSPGNPLYLSGIGTDGASNNIAAQGLKGLVEEKLDWIYWMWCVAHCLELSTKDALKGTYFDSIDDMLIKLF